MSAQPFRPFRWIAGGSGALVVTIWVALMLGLHAPSVRSVPVAPWADGGYGADAPAVAAVSDARNARDGAPSLRPALRPARVAGVRVPVAPPPAGTTMPAPAVDPPSAPAVSDPAPVVPPVPALPSAPVPPAPIPAPDIPSSTGGTDT